MRRTVRDTVEKLGPPDLDTASERVRELANRLLTEGPNALDLCAGYRSSGMDALLDRAISVVLSAHDPTTLLGMDGGELAALVGEEFARGVIRRYAVDRFAPFQQEEGLGIDGFLDFLELADLTFGTALLRGLIDDILR
ncbi:hypothetical protein [Nocardiopsis lucentensis]|uniref:hypothetical protein n=1 Tax=Nocardiopsis lucentensis TaxID=53441 RepID=UPI001F4D1F8D|nr:hypothetical protein [Nocardiopsis lucentensis]